MTDRIVGGDSYPLIMDSVNVHGPQLIANRSFTPDTTFWGIFGEDGFDVTDGVLHVEVPSGGAVSDVIVAQNVGLVVDGVYHVSFLAKADLFTSIGVVLQPLINVFLTPSWQRFTVEFTSIVANPSAQLGFWLGGVVVDWNFYLDDVSLTHQRQKLVVGDTTNVNIRLSTHSGIPGIPDDTPS